MRRTGNKPLMIEKVTRELRKWLIDNFNPGDSLPGDRKLSRRFDVSNVTICKAMQRLVDEGLVERRPRSGSSLCDRKDKLPVAVVTGIDLLHPATSQAFVRVTGEIRNLLRNANIPQELFIGYSVPGEFRRYHQLPEEFLDAVDKMALRAVIMVCVNPDPSWLDKLNAAGIPVLAIGWRYKYGVSSTTRDSIRRAVRYLYAQGRRKFAIITPNPGKLKLEAVAGLSLDHFHAALEEVGLKTRDEWIGLTGHPAHPGSGWEEAREIWIADPEDRPDALIVTDEVIFENVSVALLEMNVDIPGELHVVTQMTAGVSRRFPFPVSRYEINFMAQAEALVTMLKEILAGEEPEIAHVDIPAELLMLEGGIPPRMSRKNKELLKV